LLYCASSNTSPFRTQLRVQLNCCFSLQSGGPGQPTKLDAGAARSSLVSLNHRVTTICALSDIQSVNEWQPKLVATAFLVPAPLASLCMPALVHNSLKRSGAVVQFSFVSGSSIVARPQSRFPYFASSSGPGSYKGCFPVARSIRDSVNDVNSNANGYGHLSCYASCAS
jgi:hypothetical protein